MEENVAGNYGFRLTGKEWVMLIFGTALALGSFKSDDPWVIIPMLTIAGVSFFVLCVWHHGTVIWRFGVALALLLILVFIGWRDLRHGEKIILPLITASPPTQPPPTIIQNSDQSKCSNVVGNTVNLDCAEKDNGKVKH